MAYLIITDLYRQTLFHGHTRIGLKHLGRVNLLQLLLRVYLAYLIRNRVNDVFVAAVMSCLASAYKNQNGKFLDVVYFSRVRVLDAEHVVNNKALRRQVHAMFSIDM